MLSNTDITVYSTSGGRAYTRTVITNVFYMENSGISIQKYGVSNANKATVYIPIGKTKPSLKDYVVKGNIDFEVDGITNQMSDLQKQYDVLKVMTVDVKDYGSTNMQHYEVGLK